MITKHTVKKVNGMCQAFRVELDANGQIINETFVCGEGDQESVGSNTYTVGKRSSDNVCCIYQVFGVIGGQIPPPKEISEEGEFV